MTRSSQGIWTASVEMAVGRHEYKLIVDGDWRVDHNKEKVTNDMGSENNVLHVEEEKNDEVEEGENDEVVEESAEDEADAANCDEDDPKVSTELKEDSVAKPIILTR